MVFFLIILLNIFYGFLLFLYHKIKRKCSIFRNFVSLQKGNVFALLKKKTE